MSNELAIANPVEKQGGITLQSLQAKREFLMETVCRPSKRKATDAEFELFARVCALRQLNPLTKHIYAVFRWDSRVGGEKMIIQTSIDGFRLIAQRTGEYRGQVGPHWCGDDGEWRDVWVSDRLPTAARVGVIREGFKEPVYSVAKTSSFIQTNKEGQPTGQWANMPEVMIAKCAEAQALRRAFPEELSNIYTDDEMNQADSEGPVAQAPQRETPKVEAASGNDPRSLAFEAIQKWSGVNAEDMVSAVRSAAKAAGITPTKQTTPEEWATVLTFVEANKSRPFAEAVA